MIGLSSHHTFFYYPLPTDMRKGFDGLSGLVNAQMEMDPMNGSVYLFINRRRDRMKMLVPVSALKHEGRMGIRRVYALLQKAGKRNF